LAAAAARPAKHRASSRPTSDAAASTARVYAKR
jgi:hypothetical protein